MLRPFAYSLVLAGALAFFASPELASAQQGGADLRLGAAMVLNFGGGVQYDFPGPIEHDDRLRATPGFRLHVDKDIGRYVGVGGFARFSWWGGDDFFHVDRNLLLDLGGRITGHYDYRDFRFYGALMVGPTISKLGRDNADRYSADNTTVGLNASIAPGAEYWFDPQWAVFTEMFGWEGHFFSHDDRSEASSYHFRLNQVLWQFGVVYAP